MVKITPKMVRRYGCDVCVHKTKADVLDDKYGFMRFARACPFDKCLYKEELEKFKTYNSYVKSKSGCSFYCKNQYK